jgi:hypothetical protein
LEDQPPNPSNADIAVGLNKLVEAVVKSAIAAHKSQNLEDALAIRDELQRLPRTWMTEVINGVMLELVQIDPILCRWFILDVFLHDADPEGKADVAERINLMLADLKAKGP